VRRSARSRRSPRSPSAAPCAAAAGDVRVEASADRMELGEDETLTLTIRVEAEEAPSAIDLPEAELPFRVMSRARSSASSFSLGGGGLRARRTTELRLALAPTRTGELVIPPIVVVVQGVRHATRPIRVTVRATAAGPRGPASPDRRGGRGAEWERDLVLQVEVDRREVFLGEQATVSVWLLSPAGVVAYEAFRPPAYDGFWVEEIETPQRLAHRVRSVNGVPTRGVPAPAARALPDPRRDRGARALPGGRGCPGGLGLASSRRSATSAAAPRRRSAPVRAAGEAAPVRRAGGVRRRERREPASRGEARPSRGWRRASPSRSGSRRPARGTSAPSRSRVCPSWRASVASRRRPWTRCGRTGSRLAGTRNVETVVVPDQPGEIVVPPLTWPFLRSPLRAVRGGAHRCAPHRGRPRDRRRPGRRGRPARRGARPAAARRRARPAGAAALAPRAVSSSSSRCRPSPSPRTPSPTRTAGAPRRGRPGGGPAALRGALWRGSAPHAAGSRRAIGPRSSTRSSAPSRASPRIAWRGRSEG
jgi:hypothetical protein